jgi:hypothetical protein
MLSAGKKKKKRQQTKAADAEKECQQALGCYIGQQTGPCKAGVF